MKLKDFDFRIWDNSSRTNPLVAVLERNTFYIVDTSIEKDLQVDCAMHLQSLYEIGNIHENENLLKGGQ